MRMYKHNRTGDIYKILNSNVINCTNAQEDEIMVIYSHYHDDSLLFARERQEFYERFTAI